MGAQSKPDQAAEAFLAISPAEMVIKLGSRVDLVGCQLAVCPRNTNPHRISSYLTRLLLKNFTDCRHQCM